MIIYQYIHRNLSWFILAVCVWMLSNSPAFAQPQQPPRPIKVTKLQDLNFGSIIMGTGTGTVTILPNGTRSCSGGGIILPPGSTGAPAIFEVKSVPGTLITITIGTTTLTNGAYHLDLVTGPSEPLSPFINNQQGGTIQVRIGGTLSVGTVGQNPSGNYSGSFLVTFNQQ